MVWLFKKKKELLKDILFDFMEKVFAQSAANCNLAWEHLYKITTLNTH